MFQQLRGGLMERGGLSHPGERRGIMRFILLLAVLASLILIAANPSAAATDPVSKGSKMIGGQFLLSSSGGDLYEVNNKRVTLLEMNPYLGVFVSDGFNFGGTFAIRRYSSDDETNTSFGIGPRIAYFFRQGSRHEVRGSTYPFIGLAVMYKRITYDDADRESYDVTFSGFSFAFGGGLVYMFSRQVGISFEANYEIDNLDVDVDGYSDSESGDSFNVLAGIACFIY